MQDLLKKIQKKQEEYNKSAIEIDCIIAMRNKAKSVDACHQLTARLRSERAKKHSLMLELHQLNKNARIQQKEQRNVELFLENEKQKDDFRIGFFNFVKNKYGYKFHSLLCRSMEGKPVSKWKLIFELIRG